MAVSDSPRRLRGRPTERTPRTAARLSRAYLEDAFARLTEENARLRREVMAQSGLWQIAHQDPLTRLWNRRYADERLAEEMSRAKRESEYEFSLVLVDVDNLKRINDELGHASGDEALKWVARFLKQALRGHDLCCRLGGDEFLIVLPGSGARACQALVERIRRRWNTAADGDARAVAVSLGTASFPSQADSVETLLTIADDGMYANKRRQDPSRPARASRRAGQVPPGPDAAAAAPTVTAGVTAPGATDAGAQSATRQRNRAASI